MKNLKKLLSVVLAVTMIVSSVSVCFTSFAAGTATDAQWNTLIEALKSDAVASATFTGSANDYSVADPDGSVYAAVEAYWAVFSSMADTGNSNNNQNGKYRTINQVNEAIITQLSSKMGSSFTNAMKSFVQNLISGASISSDAVASSETTSTTPPGTTINAAADVNLTVTMDSALLIYDSLENLPDKVPTSRTYTVKHNNGTYYSSSRSSSSGCSTTTYYTYYYYYSISSVSYTDGETMDTEELVTYYNTLITYQDYFTTDMQALVAKGSSNLTSAKSAINEVYNGVVDTFSTVIWNHFYSAYDVPAATERINTALSIIEYIPIAEEIESLVATDYGNYSTSRLVTLYNTLSSKITAYEKASDDVQSYIAANKSFDLAAAKATLNAIDKVKQLSQIRDFKAEVDKDVAAYSVYDEAGIVEGTVTSAMITAAISDMNANITSLNNNYNAEYVVEVCGSDYMSSLRNLVTSLTELGEVAGYNDEFAAEYVKFAQEIKPVTNTSASSADLLAALQKYDSWYTELKSLINEMRAELGDELAEALFDDLNDEMTDHMDLAYAALKARVEAQIDTADALYTSLKEKYGDIGVTLPSLDNYKLLKDTIGLIEVDVYDYLNTTSHINLASETIAKYNALQNIVLAYDEFVASYGFSNYVQSEIDYATRLESDKDIAREDDYIVTEKDLNNTIAALDKIITSDVLGSILGGDEDFSLGGMLSDTLKGVIFTDGFINTVVQMLYPLVLGEFVEVFEDLPSEAAGVAVTYNKNLHTTTKELGFEIFPDLLASVLDSAKYADNITMLNAAVTNFDTEFGNSDGKYYTTKVNEEGKTVADKTPWDSSHLVDEDGKLKLIWGVDAAIKEGKSAADVESIFYQAFDDAVEGIKPLLLALLANTEWSPSNVSNFASAKVIFNISVNLNLSASANSGYANTLVPIYEALGVEYTPVSTVEGEYTKSSNQAADIFKAILDPIFSLVTKIGEKPIDTILSILPNLCYALSTGMVTPLLDMLKTDVEYHALAVGFLDVKNDKMNISVGSMLNLEDLGIDLSDGINSLLTSFGISLPAIDQELVGTLGELKTIDTQRTDHIYTAPESGKAYTIEANKADVAYYLLTYILGLVQNEEALTGLLGAFMTQKDKNGEAVKDEEGNTLPDTEAIAEITELIYETLNLDEMNVGDAIAAIVELANQIEYDTLENYVWYNGAYGGTVDGMTPAAQVYLSSNNNWNKETADYVVENINDIVTSILTMVGVDTSLSDILSETIIGLYTNANITAIAKGLAGLYETLAGVTTDETAVDDAAGEAEVIDESAEPEEGAEETEATEASGIDVLAVIKDAVGIDLSAFAQYVDIADDYNWDFEDGNGKGFVSALVKVLAPLTPVLDFILSGENLELISDENGAAITLIGYDGYNNALVPILEALGCNVKALGDDDDALEAVLNALVEKIAAITVDPIYGILDIIPGVIYFIASNGLSTAVRNLLQPVYVLLDTIRPIYDIDLTKLIGDLTKDLGVSINLDNLGVDFILDLASALVGLDLSELGTLIYDVCKVIGVKYESVSTVIGENGKRGSYIEGTFDRADLITVVVSFLLDWLTVEENATAIDELIGADGFVSNLIKFFEGVEPTTEKIDWMYFFGENFDFTDYDFSAGVSVVPTMLSLTYPNDWTEESAKYVDENIDEIIAAVLSLVGSEYTDLATLLADSVNIYTTENVQAIATAVQELLINIDATLIETVGVLLDVDLGALMEYTAPEGIDTADEFAEALAELLGTVDTLVEWLFLGKDIAFFTAAKGDAENGYTADGALITVNGAEGYAKGLAQILEAIGCENLPATTDENVVKLVLKSVFARVDEILADPVNEVLDILPNVIYFLNANGLSASVHNMLGAVYALLDQLAILGLELDINGLIGFDLSKLSLENLFALAEKALGLNLEALASVLTNLCVGTIKTYVSVSGEYAYKMVYDSDMARYDMITIIVTAALLMIEDEENAKALDELIGTEIISALKTVFESAPVVYVTPDWDYCLDTQDVENNTIGVIESAIEYPNDWSEETAEYLTENLSYFVDYIVALLGIKDADGENYTSLSALIDDNVNIYTGENIQVIADAVAGLLGDFDTTLLETAGLILDVDLVGLAGYTAPEGIDTAREFATELANVLATYAKGVVEWLLLGRDYAFFVNDADGNGKYVENEDIITINGGHGYAEGLALILEALGCENLPDAYDAELTTEEIINGVLTSLFTRFDEILANPVDEIFDLLPNLLYFLNANGVAAAVKNLIGAVNALIAKLAVFGVELDINSLVNIEKLLGIVDEDGNVVDLSIGLDNLTVAAILEVASVMTGLDLTILEDVLVGFALGRVEVNENSVSRYDLTYKMYYHDEFAKHDMITVLATAALLVIENENNAKVLDELIGTDVVSALTDIFKSVTIEYTSPDWDYCFDPDDMEGDTIGVMDSALTYPNDWTKESSQYVVDNIDYLDSLVAGLIDNNYASVGELVSSNVKIYSSENIQAIADAVGGLLGNIDTKLLDTAGLLLGADITGLMDYTAPEGIDTAEEFATELANLLATYAGGVTEWLLLGKNYEFFVDYDANEDGKYDEDIITINGAHGYAEGLALLLEAIGCENLPEAYSTTATTEEIINGVLTSLFTRVDEILADPVNEVFDILPNILYFLNANGVAAVIDNILAAINALLDKLSVLGVNVDIESLINIEELLGLVDENGDVLDLAISTDNLTVAAILEVASVMTGLDLTVLEDVLVGFALGSVVEYDSVSMNSTAYKMVYADDIFAKRDMITVLVTAVLLVVETEGNSEVLDELIGTEIISALKTVFESTPVNYTTPDWDYCLDTDDVENNTIGVMEYAITYPNNWTEESAQYVADNLGALGDMVAGIIDSNYTSLGALISDKITIYSGENIQAIADAVAGLLGGIDAKLIEAAGILLDVDLVGLAGYTAPAGIDTAEEFAAELTNVLTTYAGGVTEWLLLGRDYAFFVNDADGNGEHVEEEDIITINGGHGYAEGLALILEAVGCENLPEAYDTTATTEEIINGILLSLFTRVDEILADPVVEIVDILPNLLYFLNANGVAVAVDNLLAAVDALLLKLEVFGVELDINSLINVEELLGIEEDLAISLDNLTVAAILEVASVMTGLDLTILEDVLVGFALGRVEVNENSVSRYDLTYKMYYHDEFAKRDMITVIATAVLLTVKDENNADVLRELLGADVYAVILNIFNMSEVPVQEIDWQFTEHADTDYTFSALANSELYAGHEYGPLYTEDMAQYIADNFGKFVDNIIYLLGINIDGTSIDNLTELINALINGSLYNSKNVIAIRDLLAEKLAAIGSMDGGEHIVAILKASLGVDINAIANVEVPEFDKDREMFVRYLCDVIEPLYPILEWILCDEDFTFFVNEEKSDLITLTGAEGYAYGIIPLLEVLGCEGVLTPASYYATVDTDKDVLLTAILTPLLDRVDVIIENPGDEILAMLPNIIYFINSNGLDTVFKNTLNAVYTLLNAIEPIAKIDLYAVLGIRLDEVTFETLFDWAVELIAEKTGYEFSTLDANAITELTVGKLVSYTSLNGKTAYKMIYQAESAKAEMVTVIQRLMITFIMHENNAEMLIGILKSEFDMSEDAEKYVRGVLEVLSGYTVNTRLGMDSALATIYYLFHGVDTITDGATNGQKNLNAKWQSILVKLGKSDNPNEATVGNLIANVLDIALDGVFDSDGLASDGSLSFFQKLINWFNSIIEWIKNLFS